MFINDLIYGYVYINIDFKPQKVNQIDGLLTI